MKNNECMYIFRDFSIYGQIRTKNVVVSVTLSLCFQYNAMKIVYEHNTTNQKKLLIYFLQWRRHQSIYMYVCIV